MDSLLLPILMIMSGLVIGVVIKTFQNYIKIPYTVVLFAIGLLIGYIYKYDLFGAHTALDGGISLISNMNPDFILYVFLPILVFDAAYEMDLHVFNKTLLNSSILAGPGVVICMLLTGGLLMLIADICGLYDNSLWKYALMFGGLISATDPIAVVALLKELGTSKRFSTLVDGEALLNDGTGIVCFMLFYSQFNGTGVINKPFFFFVWVCIASCVIGYVMAKIALWFTTRVCKQEVVQNLVMIAAAYLTFILSQKTLSVSGVIALVVFGHMFVQSGKTRLNAGVNEFMGKFWGLLTEMANTLIFLIVGIVIATQVNLNFMRQAPVLSGQPDYVLYLVAIAMIIVVYIGLNIIRYIMIASLYPMLKRCGYGLSPRECVVLGWSGLRGAVAMTLALMVNCNPEIPQDIRGAILLLTAGTITLTLCINATTSKAIVRKLSLDKRESPVQTGTLGRIVSIIRDRDLQMMDELKNRKDLEGADWTEVRGKIIPEYGSSSYNFAGCMDELIPFLRYCVLDREIKFIEDSYSRGTICHNVYQKISNVMSEMQDFSGQKGLDKIEISFLRKKHLLRPSRRRILFELGCCTALRDTLLYGRSFLLKADDVIQAQSPEVRSQIITMLNAELDQALASVSEIETNIKKSNPEIYAEFVTESASRILLAGERDNIDALFADGILSGEDAAILKTDTDARQGIEIYE